MTYNENLRQNAEDNVYYWVATFRQLTVEESNVHPSTTTGPILVKSTQQSTTTRDRTLELFNMTTERTTQTSANLPTKISTFFAKEENVTQSGTMSKSMKSEECIFFVDRQACVSGYQELNICIDKTKEQNVQESDNNETVKDPWETLARKAIESKLLKIPKSIKKIRRQTVATMEDEYDTPNPVIESNERHGLPVPYKSTSPLVITNRCNNLASRTFNRKQRTKK
ncbi:unnamed protein product [Mytilus coruscus]|uniref:Uncharacterized protein n=1 Tax=Mytilus coruscus TaxID=42192 RepID=A0A6J8AJ83_MYTCO|nr:unnamed protein product [Mytilus coruscus]